jgi:hypothetical protein
MPTLPGATTTLAGMGAWSQPVFEGMLPYAYFAGGVLLGVGIILFIIYIATTVVSHMRGH